MKELRECVIDLEAARRKVRSSDCKTIMKLLKHDMMEILESTPGLGKPKHNNGRLHPAMKKSLDVLQEIYNNPDEKTEIRVKAASACLPFEYHRKPQQLDINAEVNIQGVFGHMIRAIGVDDLEGQIIDETAKRELEQLEDLSDDDK